MIKMLIAALWILVIIVSAAIAGIVVATAAWFASCGLAMPVPYYISGILGFFAYCITVVFVADRAPKKWFF